MIVSCLTLYGFRRYNESDNLSIYRIFFGLFRICLREEYRTAGGDTLKLLIVEDEKAIRESLLSMLPWEELGIREIRTEDNGEKGLAAARSYAPDIVLADIRMPRMTGLVMAERIVELLPKTQIILMSAFADIEYYRAAIQLHAVDYVEKPIDRERLMSAVRTAVRRRGERDDVQQAQSYRNRDLRLALVRRLTEADRERLDAFLRENKTVFPNLEGCSVTSFVVGHRWFHVEASRPVRVALELSLSEWGDRHKMYVVTGWSEGYRLMNGFCFHESDELSRAAVMSLSERISEGLKYNADWYGAVGRPGRWYYDAPWSWMEAKGILRQCFYEDYGVFLSPESGTPVGYRSYHSERMALLQSIESLRKEEMDRGEQMLFEQLLQRRNLPRRDARDMYHEFLLAMIQTGEKSGAELSREYDLRGQNVPLNAAVYASNLIELHAMYREKLTELFEKLSIPGSDNSSVSAARSYIRRNYGNPRLSLQDISNYVGISNSHFCTLFRQETGITINQYITEVRLERAKKLLRESKDSVTRVSALCGYTDNNYFGRLFHKTFGLTPMEYRETWRNEHANEGNEAYSPLPVRDEEAET